MSSVPIPESRPILVEPSGDAPGVDRLARLLFGTASRHDDFAACARAARPDGTWSGRAYEAYVAATGRAAREHDELAAACRRVARTVAASSDTLAGLHTDYRRLVADKLGCDARRRQLVRDATEAAAGPQPELHARARALERAYTVLVDDHRRLQRRVADNEALLVRAFTGTTSLAPILSGQTDRVAVGAMDRPGAPGTGSSTGRTHAWWAGLTPAQRAAVVAAYPQLVGGCAGVPARARDRANRILLEDTLAELGQKERDGTLSDRDRRLLVTARSTRRALWGADHYLDPVTGRLAGGCLWTFDPAAYDGDGRVVVGVGDPDTAADVCLRVPGVSHDGSSIDALTTDAIAVYQSARQAGDGSSVASLAWLGYDAPDSLVDPASRGLDRAETGGAALAGDVAALLTGRPPAHVTLIGHSYGSDVVTQALLTHHAPVGDVVLVGSPGVSVTHATQLGIGAGHVWVGSDTDDPMTLGSPLGADPAATAFGAHRFQAQDPTVNGVLDLAHHSAYFRPDTESAYNVGRVVDGTPDRVRLARPRLAQPPTTGPAGHLGGLPVTVDPESVRPATAGLPGLSATGVPAYQAVPRWPAAPAPYP